MIKLILLLSLNTPASALTKNVALNQPGDIESSVQLLTSTIQSREPRMVLLGEDHRDMLSKSFYKSVIQRLAARTSKRICYFHELSEDYQPALEQISKSPETAVQNFESHHTVLSKAFLEVFGRAPNHWLNVDQLVELSRKGVKQYAVDTVKTRDDLNNLKLALVKANESGDEKSLANVDEILFRKRNEHMSAKIKEIFRREKCEIGFLSVGGDHIFPLPRHNKIGIKGIGQILRTELAALRVNAVTCQAPMECQVERTADLNILFKP